jgi:hypothetical protein
MKREKGSGVKMEKYISDSISFNQWQINQLILSYILLIPVGTLEIEETFDSKLTVSLFLLFI